MIKSVVYVRYNNEHEDYLDKDIGKLLGRYSLIHSYSIKNTKKKNYNQKIDFQNNGLNYIKGGK